MRICSAAIGVALCFGRGQQRPCPRMCADLPQSAVGMDGGDVWSGARVTQATLEDVVDEATSTTIGTPIIAQYYPGRAWLWQQWTGTILRRVLLREVLSTSHRTRSLPLSPHQPHQHVTEGVTDHHAYASLAATWQVLYNGFFAVCVCLFFRAPGPNAAWRAGLTTYLGGVARVWTLAATMVASRTLSPPLIPPPHPLSSRCPLANKPPLTAC